VATCYCPPTLPNLHAASETAPTLIEAIRTNDTKRHQDAQKQTVTHTHRERGAWTGWNTDGQPHRQRSNGVEQPMRAIAVEPRNQFILPPTAECRSCVQTCSRASE